MVRIKKRGEFNFVWLFALVAGAAILVLAIYGAIQIGDTQRFGTDTALAKSLSVIIDPLQAGFAEGVSSRIEFRQETRIFNNCFVGEFGSQEISVATRSGIGEEWKPAGGATTVNNKYVFSSFEEGETFYVFSKSFDFPYKVADLIFMSSKDYCFISPPEEIEEEIVGLNMENIKVDGVQNCSGTAIDVCFDIGDCEIEVVGTCSLGCESEFDEGYVLKDGVRNDYVGSLLYGAIFSEDNLYDCNVQRLLYRTSNVASLFAKKSDLMAARGCDTGLSSSLENFAGLSLNAEVNDLDSLSLFAKNLEDENKRRSCELW